MELIKLKSQFDDLDIDFTPVEKAAINRLNALLDAFRAKVYTAIEVAPMIVDIEPDLPEIGACGCYIAEYETDYSGGNM